MMYMHCTIYKTGAGSCDYMALYHASLPSTQRWESTRPTILIASKGQQRMKKIGDKGVADEVGGSHAEATGGQNGNRCAAHTERSSIFNWGRHSSFRSLDWSVLKPGWSSRQGKWVSTRVALQRLHHHVWVAPPWDHFPSAFQMFFFFLNIIIEKIPMHSDITAVVC